VTSPVSEKNYLIVLAGPTASGKTATAVKLAQHFNTVVVSADSRQCYKEMKIGTAVPSSTELKAVKHYFIQNRSIHQAYDVATYEQDVLALLDKLFVQHRVVLLSGGSGLFIDAVCHGIDNIPETDEKVRTRVQNIYDTAGLAGLQQHLQRLDPKYYEIVDKRNPRRLQRALEVCLQTGKTFTFYRKRQTQARNFEVIWLALEVDRTELINRINMRVEQMMANGLLEEARKLYSFKHLNALQTVGYQEFFDYFDHRCSMEEAIENVKTNTRRYAKRQMTWFRKNKSYSWFKPTEIEAMIGKIENSML
jgi:tRNA dimethylallyltransferase